METAIISAEINKADIPLLKDLLKRFKAKSVKVEEKIPVEMSKEEFFTKIDKARKGKKIKMDFNELERIMLE